MSELVWRSIGELARAIAGREVSPVEVVQAHLDRVAALDAKLRAFITVSADAALATAKAAEAAVMAGERLGPLHGVPLEIGRASGRERREQQAEGVRSERGTLQ